MLRPLAVLAQKIRKDAPRSSSASFEASLNSFWPLRHLGIAERDLFASDTFDKECLQSLFFRISQLQRLEGHVPLPATLVDEIDDLLQSLEYAIMHVQSDPVDVAKGRYAECLPVLL